MKFGYDGYSDLYRSIAINEYDPLGDNDYSVSGPNDYYLKLINCVHNDTWFMGEDK